MNILHVCTSDKGGAGLCCLRIHKSLLDSGVNSRVVVQIKESNEREVYQYEPIRNWFYRVISMFCRVLRLPLTARSRVLLLGQEYNTTYSLPVSYVDITKCDLYHWADVIHLHWVNNYLDYPSFFLKNDKPVVWTLHDENLFYGIAHHHHSILKDNPLEKKYRMIKNEALASTNNLTIVFLSSYMYNKFGTEKVIEGKQKTIISNSVNGSIFKIGDKKYLRRKYGFEEDKIIILFIAQNINDPNKGLSVLSQAVSDLHDDRFVVLALGGNANNTQWPCTFSYGSVYDPSILSELISTADMFALPSFQEAFPQSPLEAMSCGIPVLAFPVSGVVEAVDDSNGYICEDFTKAELIRGIKHILSEQYNPDIIRNGVLSRYSPEIIANKYIHLYNTLN